MTPIVTHTEYYRIEIPAKDLNWEKEVLPVVYQAVDYLFDELRAESASLGRRHLWRYPDGRVVEQGGSGGNETKEGILKTLGLFYWQRLCNAEETVLSVILSSGFIRVSEKTMPGFQDPLSRYQRDILP